MSYPRRLCAVVVGAVAVLACGRQPDRPSAETSCTLASGTITCQPVTSTEPADGGAADGHTVRIPGPVSSTVVAPLGDFGCAISAGAVYGWGVGKEGQLGDGVRSEERRGPVRVVDVADAVSLAADVSSVCALDRVGRVHCWGGLFAIEIVQPTRAPLASVVAEGARAIAASGVQTCAALAAGVACWGGWYATADGRQARADGITAVPETAGADRLRGHEAAMCAVWPDDRQRCWSTTPLPLVPAAARP